MSWPFKIFDDLRIKVAGGSHNTKAKQEVSISGGSVLQAGRDINNVTVPAQVEEIPYAFISGTRCGGNGMHTNFGGNITNASDKTLFIEKFEFLEDDYEISQLHLDPHQTKRFEPVATTYPASDKDGKLNLYFSDTNGNHYVTAHTLHFFARADGKFNVDGITAERPAKKL